MPTDYPVIVPRWPRSTVVCLASGPSLTAADVRAVVGRWPIIAVNDAVQLAPEADVLYSSDLDWWRRSSWRPEFGGARVSIERDPGRGRRGFDRADVQVLRNTGREGLELDPSGLRTYQNSGGAAINLAVHFGAARIVLLGYDMQIGAGGRRHFHDARVRMKSPYSVFRQRIATMVGPLKALGIEVINASRQTALTCFPRRPLEEVLG